jgi:hypothetical protein
MIPDINIWRVVNLMIKRYGDEADIESALRTDKLWEVGDAAGVAVWRRVMGPIRQLVNTAPPGPFALNGGHLRGRRDYYVHQ